MVDLLEGFDCRFYHQFAGMDAVDVRWIVAQEAGVKVVVAQLAGDDNVEHLQIVVDSACDAGVDDALHLKAVDHHLGGDGSVDLADAAAADNSLLSAEDAFPEEQTSDLDLVEVLHLLLEHFYFRRHCADDSPFHILSSFQLVNVWSLVSELAPIIAQRQAKENCAGSFSTKKGRTPKGPALQRFFIWCSCQSSPEPG